MTNTELPEIPCRFSQDGCRSPATAIYCLPKGCACWPDPIQALCPQHAYKSADISGIFKIYDLYERPLMTNSTLPAVTDIAELVERLRLTVAAHSVMLKEHAGIIEALQAAAL